MGCVITRARPRTDGEEGLRVLSVLQRCQEAFEQAASRSATPATLPATPYQAHASAFIDQGVEIGEGTSIWHTSHILTGSRIGKNCKIGQNVVVGSRVTVGHGVKIQNNVSVYEGVTLEDHVFCGPSMVFTNVFNPRSEILRMNELKPTLVRRGATLGANSTIVCGRTIGQYALIGAGAVVGNPGWVTGWMCRCGVKLHVDDKTATCTTCGQQYRAEPTGMTAVEPRKGDGMN